MGKGGAGGRRGRLGRHANVGAQGRRGRGGLEGSFLFCDWAKKKCNFLHILPQFLFLPQKFVIRYKHGKERGRGGSVLVWLGQEANRLSEPVGRRAPSSRLGCVGILVNQRSSD